MGPEEQSCREERDSQAEEHGHGHQRKERDEGVAPPHKVLAPEAENKVEAARAAVDLGW